MRDEVSEFLATARHRRHKDLVKPQDIPAIFALKDHPRRALQWSIDGLIWSDHAREDAVTGMWQEIVHAVNTQLIALRRQISTSKLII